MVFACSTNLSAQQLGNPGKYSGKVAKVGEDWIEITTAAEATLRIVVSQAQLDGAMGAAARDPATRKTLRLSVEGTAAPGALAKGQYVAFSAQLSPKWQSQADVTELTIVTPDDVKRPGRTLTDAAPDGAAASRGGNYLIVGQVQSFRGGQLAVVVPDERGKQQTIKVKLADDAEVKLAVADLSLAQPGSAVQAEGYALMQRGQPVPNVMLGEVVQIRLAEAIGGRKTAAAKPARAERARAETAAADKELRARRDSPPADQNADDASPQRNEGSGESLVQPGDPPPAELILKDEKFTVDGPVSPQKKAQDNAGE